MELKKSWKAAWEKGAEMAKAYDSEDAACWAMSMDELEAVSGRFTSKFFHAGFVGREPEWVEAIRFGEIPECGYSRNWADGSVEPGVSCVKILREAGDEDIEGIYAVTCGDREKIRVAGWWLGLSGSDGEPCLLGAVKLD